MNTKISHAEIAILKIWMGCASGQRLSELERVNILTLKDGTSCNKDRAKELVDDYNRKWTLAQKETLITAIDILKSTQHPDAQQTIETLVLALGHGFGCEHLF